MKHKSCNRCEMEFYIPRWLHRLFDCGRQPDQQHNCVKDRPLGNRCLPEEQCAVCQTVEQAEICTDNLCDLADPSAEHYTIQCGGRI